MLEVMLAKETAPSSLRPRWPTASTLAPVRVYWRRHVTMRGEAFLMRRRSSCLYVVSDLSSAAIWSSHCLNTAALDVPSKAVVSVGSLTPGADGCLDLW